MKPFAVTDSSYQLVNLLTGGVIILIFLYSAFSGSGGREYPVVCAHVSFYGMECPTCGLSRSFSEMSRGNFSSAAGFNRNGPLLFGFFSIQLFLRALAGMMLVSIQRNFNQTLSKRKIKLLAVTDSIISGLLFLVCFRFLLVFW
jgi:hypothetical protein